MFLAELRLLQNERMSISFSGFSIFHSACCLPRKKGNLAASEGREHTWTKRKSLQGTINAPVLHKGDLRGVRFNDIYVPLKRGNSYLKPEMGKCGQFREGGPQPPASPAPTFLTSGCFVLWNEPAIGSFVTCWNRRTYFHPPLSGAVTLEKSFSSSSGVLADRVFRALPAAFGRASSQKEKNRGDWKQRGLELL